jgi:hypothetical protein
MNSGAYRRRRGRGRGRGRRRRREEEDQWLTVKTAEAGGELLFTVHISREQWRMQKTKEKMKGKEKGKGKRSGWR